MSVSIIQTNMTLHESEFWDLISYFTKNLIFRLEIYNCISISLEYCSITNFVNDPKTEDIFIMQLLEETLNQHLKILAAG